MRRNPTVAIALGFALLTAACGSGEDGSSTLGPVPTSESTGNASPTPAPVSATALPSGGSGSPSATASASGSATPTATPTSSIMVGEASLVVTGGLQTSQSAIPLISPAVYTPPPGGFALSWQSVGAGFALAGKTFVGTRQTSDVMRLSFYVHASSATYRFSSIDGGCSVTVSAPPDATTFSGTYTCGSVVDDSGAITVTAQGTFLASE